LEEGGDIHVSEVLRGDTIEALELQELEQVGDEAAELAVVFLRLLLLDQLGCRPVVPGSQL
jgi:hypothetical protein